MLVQMTVEWPGPESNTAQVESKNVSALVDIFLTMNEEVKISIESSIEKGEDDD